MNSPERDEWRSAHAGSGVTSGLILAYVEREAGRQAVEEMLCRAGLADRELELRNESCWFSFETKIRLWDAAAQITDDPHVALHVGASALDLRVGMGLKRALRALGSPELVYRNVVRANSKFNWAHTLEVGLLESGHVRLAYRDVSNVGYHHYDCDYTTGLLCAVPELFGMARARVTHPVCGARGEEHCEFDVRWARGQRSLRRTGLATGLAAISLTAAGAIADRHLFVAGIGLGSVTAGVGSARAAVAMRRRIKALETEVHERDIAADAQLTSLAALSSELRLEKALDRIIASASSVIGGARFVLLAAEPDGMRAHRHSSIPAPSLLALEAWAHENRQKLRRGPLVLDRLAGIPSVCSVAEDRELPLGSACAAPMLFHDRLLGVLIALAPGAMVFLPGDVRSLEIYAGHAAIAIWNARLVESLEREAAEDPLTELANRRAFNLACAAELENAGRLGTAIALVVLDIDYFKLINDTYGHQFGDLVLRQVADSLRSVVRGHDTIARIGGEEFALLLPGADLDEGHAIAERARAVIATIELPHAKLSCSAGVAATGGAGAPAGDLFAIADRALYDAKRQGRGRTERAEVSYSSNAVRPPLSTSSCS